MKVSREELVRIMQDYVNTEIQNPGFQYVIGENLMYLIEAAGYEAGPHKPHKGFYNFDAHLNEVREKIEQEKQSE